MAAIYSFKKRKRIDTNPDYQRPAVWTKAQKQLLIDSILRDFDVPKIYLHEKTMTHMMLLTVSNVFVQYGRSMMMSSLCLKMLNLLMVMMLQTKSIANLIWILQQ